MHSRIQHSFQTLLSHCGKNQFYVQKTFETDNLIFLRQNQIILLHSQFLNFRAKIRVFHNNNPLTKHLSFGVNIQIFFFGQKLKLNFSWKLNF
mgnify:CR=1 FL=1